MPGSGAACALAARACSRRGLPRVWCAEAATADVARAAPARQFTAVVDLTHTMSPEFPTFFGVPGIEMEKKFDFRKDGFNLYWWRIIEHAGTHLDAPIHFSEAGATAEKIPPTRSWRRSPSSTWQPRQRRTPIISSRAMILPPGRRSHGRLPDNCCVAMHSGWAQHVGDAAKFTGKDAAGVLHFPGVRSGGGRVADEGAQGCGAWRSTRCRSTTVRRRISRFTQPGCRPDAGGLRMSPVSTKCRRRAPPWWWDWRR